jgi:hypothetical protein
LSSESTEKFTSSESMVGFHGQIARTRLQMSERGSGGLTFVVMMQASHFREFDHTSFCGPLYPSGLGRVFAERQVSSPLVTISAVRRQRAAERAFAENDDLVQALAANRANDSFHVGSLPRRPWG